MSRNQDARLRTPAPKRPAIRGTSPKHIRGFDGVRGLAAVTVVGIHAGAFEVLGPRETRLLAPVTIFFVLSGFLITRNLLLEERDNGAISLFGFWRNRVLRILPCYVALLVAIRFATDANYIVPVTDRHFWTSAFYVSNFIDHDHYSGPLGATWSLAVEEHFYLLWPLAFLVLSRIRLRAAALTGLATCAVFRVLLDIHPLLFHGFYPARWTLPAADALLCGCLLALLHFSPRSSELLQRWTARRLPLGIAAVLLYAAPAWFPGYGHLLTASISYYMQVAGIAAALLWLFSHQTSAVVRFLEIPPIRYLGKISYGLYVWQGFWLSTGPADQLRWLQQPPQALAVVLLTATMSWYIIERPFLRWKDRSRRREHQLEGAVAQDDSGRRELQPGLAAEGLATAG